MNAIDRVKYRAKRIDNGEWVIGFVAQVDNRVFISDPCQYISEIESGMFFAMQLIDGFEEVDPETVGQLIYEDLVYSIHDGDIVNYRRYASDETMRAQVRYDDRHAKWVFFTPRGQHDFTAWDLHVIGNIHDNPELLEVES